MYLKFKKLHQDAVIPSYANKGDAGLDLVATSLQRSATDDYWEYGTGLAVEIPTAMVGLLFPRSSISKTSHFLRNSVGVIDAGYRGEIKLRMSSPKNGNAYKVGERIGQLLVLDLPILTVIEEELSESARGTDGFGSTGT